ncbi:MAG: fibrobacter succinogenes major paralogous domain-containing protein [Chitinispirillales bacterium]|jgi:uncharacterized protein (TIGR02145 family)|nr:fibrobacter succinogenes major paralogous domain-containing protein [Chitinispirillales bacterium]
MESLNKCRTGNAFGEFTDIRDDQKYRTVKIGSQVWMAENLNFKIDGSWCYDDDEVNGKIYGMLYTWDAAMAACPVGWHLPTRDEWKAMLEAVGGWEVAGKHLKSKTGWLADYEIKNLDTYGFSALPGGSRNTGGSFITAGLYGHWWTATKNGNDDAYGRSMYYRDGRVYEGVEDVSAGLSVRCVMED